MDVFSTTLNGRPLTIERSGAVCPPACVQPMQAASGVVTIGELEVLDFIDLLVSDAKGLLLDARLPEGFGSGTVPGAVNVPASTLRPQNPYRDDLLSALGVEGDDFSAAFDLVIFGAAADDPEAPGALRDLLAAGYPAAKLKYYRGGVQAWQGMGLSLAASE
ncbi:rhodanese-like domain-containing protein [Sagittula salina]|uniref:Rhodanese-like domain-containing protein n=1 Tax=Sagittula salina TaxID=2820268 RepID=A0A940S0J7_9RHOB|nr:rhodanese-like domain-containing protein [Sagittula salina]MBP0483153.1 rhodanese-like domain-containing protein [Sagittula salina]